MLLPVRLGPGPRHIERPQCPLQLAFQVSKKHNSESGPGVTMRSRTGSSIRHSGIKRIGRGKREARESRSLTFASTLPAVPAAAAGRRGSSTSSRRFRLGPSHRHELVVLADSEAANRRVRGRSKLKSLAAGRPPVSRVHPSRERRPMCVVQVRSRAHARSGRSY